MSDIYRVVVPLAAQPGDRVGPRGEYVVVRIEGNRARIVGGAPSPEQLAEWRQPPPAFSPGVLVPRSDNVLSLSLDQPLLQIAVGLCDALSPPHRIRLGKMLIESGIYEQEHNPEDAE